MPDPTYATEVDFRAYVTVDEQNPGGGQRMKQCLLSAEDAVDAYTRGLRAGARAFSVTASEQRRFDDVLGRGWLDIDDATAITAVVRGSTTIDATEYLLHPYGGTPYTRIIWDRLAVGTYAEMDFYRNGVGLATVYITGTWGYCAEDERPAAIKEATLVLASLFYRRPSIPPAEMLQAMRSPVNDDLALVKSLLAPYRKSTRVNIA